MSKIRKLFVGLLISAYLGTLCWGVAAHALKVGLCGNTLSYFVVWDMFCGWSAWDQRTHFVAEGASGQFYDVKEPWGTFEPFGSVGRIHYDHTNHLLTKHIEHVLSHTKHEPISRVYAVQEVWPKQYNLPPGMYKRYFQRDKDKQSYFHVRAVCTERGQPLQINPSWLNQQSLLSLYDNPRIRQQSQQATSMYSTLYAPRSGRQSNALPGGAPYGLTTN